MESVSNDKNIEMFLNEDKQSASGISTTDSGTCTNTEEPGFYTEKQLEKFKCHICSKQLFSKGSLKHHKRIHAEVGCHFCRLKFTAHRTMKYHTRQKHPQKYVQFLLNGQTKSIVKIPLLNIPKCCTCNQMFCSMEALYKHHADCDHKCIECDLLFVRKDCYYKHLEREHGIKIEIPYLECPFCQNKFMSTRGLNEHITRLHSEIEDSNASTNVKKKQLSPVRTLNIQEQSLSLNKPLINNESLTKNEFIAKYVTVYQGDMMNCTLCETKFRKRNITRHLIALHSVVKPFKCPFCPLRFNSTDVRKCHLYSVHPDNFQCKICDIQFELSEKYSEHMLNNHGLDVKLPLNVEEHDISFNDLKFSCNKNDKTFTKDSFVKENMVNISTDTTRCFPCQRNIRKDGIIYHLIRFHATERPFKCAFCIKRFTRADYRTKHMKTQHPTCYYCHSCDVQFSHHKIYAEHMKTIHFFTMSTQPEDGEEDDIHLNDMTFLAVLTPEHDNYHNSNHRPIKNKTNKAMITYVNDCSSKKPLNKEEFVEKYISTCNNNTLYCKACTSRLSINSLLQHLKRWHATINFYICPFCDESFDSYDVRAKHIHLEHPNELKCSLCNLQYFKTTLYVEHMQTEHGIKVESTKKDKKTSRNISDMLFVVRPKRIPASSKVSVY